LKNLNYFRLCTLYACCLLWGGAVQCGAQNAVIQAGPSVLIIPDARNALIFKGFNGHYSRKLQKKLSVGLSAIVGLPTATESIAGPLLVNTFYIQPELRWYTERMLYGFYVGIGLNAQDYRIKQRINGRKVELGNNTHLGAALLFGYQQPFHKNWSAHFSAGINWSNVILGPGAGNPNGASVFAGIGVGYLLYEVADKQ
jgi:hypothetical protein